MEFLYNIKYDNSADMPTHLNTKYGGVGDVGMCSRTYNVQVPIRANSSQEHLASSLITRLHTQ